MTLAVILFVGIYCTSACSPVDAAIVQQAWEQSPPVNSPPSSQTQMQGSEAPAASSSTPGKPASAQTSSPPKAPAAKHPHKKKRVTSNCVPASAATAPSPQGTPASSPAQSADQTGAPVKALTVCPPPKIIVRQGGTSEPSIQLAGGAVGDQAAHQKATANQMLGYTEANLKKIAGKQLAANQQDMVNQIHQFMEQSKSAVAAGDTERARTLAWKAQLLSEELVNPK